MFARWKKITEKLTCSKLQPHLIVVVAESCMKDDEDTERNMIVTGSNNCESMLGRLLRSQ